MGKTFSISLAIAVTTACGGAGNESSATLPTGPSPVSAEVEFSIVSSSANASTATECAEQIRLHPSWWGFAQVNVVPTEPDAWGILFEDVPIGHQTVRLRAPAGCGKLSLGANGIELTDRETGASQITFRFLVHADGSVTP